MSLSLAHAEPETQVLKIEMGGSEHSFSERCVHFEQGQQVEYRFDAHFPLDFNIHYHTANTTEFARKEVQVTELVGNFVVRDVEEYCFMWTNKQFHDAGWSFSLNYRVL